ncbi:MAG: thioredoxin family protein [Theionarchaea archaeon]|nr:thioredoxin family protein [Theionarchaea archaeon]
MKVFYLALILIFASIVFPLSAQEEIIYFYEEGCPQCARVSLLLDEIAQEYSVRIVSYDVATVEGYTLFKEYGFVTTPALIIEGKKVGGEGIEITKSDIIRALQKYEWFHFIISLGLGLLSGLSPTLMNVHADIISEVARTTRREMDVVLRSLLFYVGIFAVQICLFFIFEIDFLHFMAVLLGFVLSLNLLNSGLHSFNSYTRIDLYIKAKFITLEPQSVLKLGFLHGLVKFSDSVPFFLVLLWFIITRGSLSEDIYVGLLFFLGIVLSYFLVFAMAIVQVNLFRTFKEELLGKIYFTVSGIAVMAISLWMLWEIQDEISIWTGVILAAAVIVVSGVLVGFKRRIVV